MPTDSAITYDDIGLFYKKFVENLQKKNHRVRKYY